MLAAMTIIIHDKMAIVLMVWLLLKFCVLSLEMSEFYLLCYVLIFSTVVDNTFIFPNHHTSITPPLLTLQMQIALMHVYVRRVNFTTKSRFQNIKLRSFA